MKTIRDLHFPHEAICTFYIPAYHPVGLCPMFVPEKDRYGDKPRRAAGCNGGTDYRHRGRGYASGRAPDSLRIADTRQLLTLYSSLIPFNSRLPSTPRLLQLPDSLQHPLKVNSLIADLPAAIDSLAVAPTDNARSLETSLDKYQDGGSKRNSNSGLLLRTRLGRLH